MSNETLKIFSKKMNISRVDSDSSVIILETEMYLIDLGDVVNDDIEENGSDKSLAYMLQIFFANLTFLTQNHTIDPGIVELQAC
ncbi:hypothetical protein CEXT_607271 [Caerostris extrusa]|uniref:Uncharacterized protein n=1 Tax=Caerostris extrusa TaxID=172846 RepID=A0AAV4R6C2_CAEEX|nr:hypothetical protein CEXT_607271 [Caerostris extrusa]